MLYTIFTKNIIFAICLASFLGDPFQGASIEPYEALVAQGIASMVGVAHFQPTEQRAVCLKVRFFAIL